MSKPRTLLVLRPDTLGDLVLFSASLRRLRMGMPEARIRVLVRETYASLTPLLGEDIEWLYTDINPFGAGPDEVWPKVEALADRLGGEAPELILAPCRQRSWLERALVALLPPSRVVCCGTTEPPPFYQAETEARVGATLQQREPWSCVEIPPETKDWETGYLLTEHLGIEGARSVPTIRIPEVFRAEGTRMLGQLGLQPGAYVICAAAGFANVPLKTWPAERFAACLRHLGERHGLPALLVGSRQEESYLERVRSLCPETPVRVWTGGTGELPLLAALTGAARLFLGNDTGAMHLAAAMKIPGVAIFGGGTWPRFIPASETLLPLVHPLPCQGCAWDCPFGEALCIKFVDTQSAITLLDRVLEGSATRDGLSLSGGIIPKELLGHVRRQHQAQSRQLESKQKEILATQKEAEKRQAEILMIQKEAENRQMEILTIKREADERQMEILRIKREADERQADLGFKAEEYRRVLEVTRERERQLEEKDQEIMRLTASASERLDQLEAKDQEIKLVHAAAAERLQCMIRLDADVRRVDAERARLEGECVRLQAELEQAQKALSQSQGNIGRLKDRADLEANRRFGDILREKEQVLQSLHRACHERELVIRGLSSEEFRSLGALRKAGATMKAWLRRRIGLPLEQACTRRLLKDQSQELGKLHQYAPRPLRWDTLPQGGRACLPRIGLVTPSYNQAQFLGRTMDSVSAQAYPNLKYVVQDGGSSDGSAELIRAREFQLHAWVSQKDAGQAAAIRQGFAKLETELGPEDLMAWLNSDDLLAPGAMLYVAEYFRRHPDVDAVYGHRLIIDAQDREIGRWILPAHDPEDLRWFDFIPQETLFWRKRVWDRLGGLDPDFHFALDWDFLVRMQEAGAKIRRLPRVLGAFRVHEDSKTHSQINTRGQEEMTRLLSRLHGGAVDYPERHARLERIQRRSALCAQLLRWGLRV